MEYDWIWNSNIVQVATKYNLCVILPSGENSFYLDGVETGRKYGTFVGEELLEYVRNTFHLSKKIEDTFICGLSMGGFGATHVALQFPDYYGKFAALSSAFIVPGIKDMKPGMELDIANYEYYKLMFGELSELESSDRVLRMKYRLNLFDKPYYNLKDYPLFGGPEHAAAALEAAEESLVLLKNVDNTLPLTQGAKLLITGPNANSMRTLNGGWSYSWQGDKADACAEKYNNILESFDNKFVAENSTY